MHYFFKNLLFYSGAWVRQTKDYGQTKCIVMMVYQTFKFYDPWGMGHISLLVKMQYFFSSGAWSRQIRCKIMMTKEGSTKIVTIHLMIPRAGGRGGGMRWMVKILVCIIILMMYTLLLYIHRL